MLRPCYEVLKLGLSNNNVAKIAGNAIFDMRGIISGFLHAKYNF